MTQVTIIGCGMGKETLLTAEARQAILGADLVLATGRLATQLGGLHPNTVTVSFSEINSRLQEAEGSVAILASGDVGYFSISRLLCRQHKITLINGLSSLQYFCAKLGETYDDAISLSVHGRNVSAVPYVAYNRKTFILTGGDRRAHDVAAELTAAGLGGVLLAAGENLSAANQRILRGTAAELAQERFEDLTVLLAINENATDPAAELTDKDFLRGEIPMTKEEIRAISLLKLHITPAMTLWDIGAGTGSVAIAAARRANRGMVYAVERKPEAVELIRKNIAKLGAYNVCVTQGSAPQVLLALPQPDCVFIGGSGGNMDEIFAAVLAKNENARIVVNAIALETLGEARAAFARQGIPCETVCVNTARAEQIGRYAMMQANNPIYIISGGGK